MIRGSSPVMRLWIAATSMLALAERLEHRLALLHGKVAIHYRLVVAAG